MVSVLESTIIILRCAVTSAQVLSIKVIAAEPRMRRLSGVCPSRVDTQYNIAHEVHARVRVRSNLGDRY